MRCSPSISVPTVPEIEGQAGKALAAAGLPAVTDAIRPDTVLFKVKNFSDVVPGIAADTDDIEKGFVVGIFFTSLIE